MSRLYQLLHQGQVGRTWVAYLALGVSCIAYVLMPLLIVKMLSVGAEHRLLVALFVTSVLTYSLCQNRFSVNISQRLHLGVGQALLRVTENLVRLDLATVERLGPNRIGNLIAHEVGILSGVSDVLGSMIQKLGVTFLIGGCVLFVSPAAAMVWVGLIVLCLWHSWNHSEKIRLQAVELARYDSRQRDYVDGLILGLRQIQASRRLRKGLRAAMCRHGKRSGELESRIGGHMLTMWQGYHMSYFLGLACYLYFFSAYSLLAQNDVLSLVMLLTLTPINDVAQGIPQVLRAAVSARRLGSLEARLESARPRGGRVQRGREDALEWAPGSELQMKGVTFRYRDASAEVPHFGPFDLSLRSGEIILVEGSNGSGKSTLLKLLTGLYPAQGGSIQVGGRPVGEHNVSRYQALFSYAAAEPFLFDRPYGTEVREEAAIRETLKRCRVPEEALDIHEGRFIGTEVNLDLRKRVALAVALLENRPILILDEIGGNQDAAFCEFYYHILLPELKKQGKTIVLVSHDRRFFDVADRRLRMEKGKLV